MKQIKVYLMAIAAVVLSFGFVEAQSNENYKAPKIDANGKITNAEGKHIGWVTQKGIVTDTLNNKIAYIEGDGELMDAKTGKKIGKAEKNGNYSFYPTTTPDDKWSVSPAENGTCKVLDSKGNVIADVHENYKAQGACAIHCLTKGKKK